MRLDEIFEEVKAYHGGNTPIHDFRPLTHFGTARAANQRVAYKYGQHGSVVYPVYLDIQKPLRVTDAEASDEGTLMNAIARGAYPQIDSHLARREGVIAALKAAGYDGLVYKNGMEDRGKLSWVIFDPSQVRPAV